MLLTGLLKLAIQGDMVSCDKLPEATERATDGLDAPSVLPAPHASQVTDITPGVVGLMAHLVFNGPRFGAQVTLSGRPYFHAFGFAVFHELISNNELGRSSAVRSEPLDAASAVRSELPTPAQAGAVPGALPGRL